MRKFEFFKRASRHDTEKLFMFGRNIRPVTTYNKIQFLIMTKELFNKLAKSGALDSNEVLQVSIEFATDTKKTSDNNKRGAKSRR